MAELEVLALFQGDVGGGLGEGRIARRNPRCRRTGGHGFEGFGLGEIGRRPSDGANAIEIASGDVAACRIGRQ